jgi:hypothetical protein
MDILKPDLMWIEGRCYRLNIQDSFCREMGDKQFENTVLDVGMLLAILKEHYQFRLTVCLYLNEL